MAKTSAHTMATSVGVDPNVFRSLLIDQKFAWHAHGSNWMVEIDTPEHRQMIAVLKTLFVDQPKPGKPKAPAKPKASVQATVTATTAKKKAVAKKAD